MFSFFFLGRVFPVTQSVVGPDSWNGKPLHEEFDSHFVLVKRKGICADVTTQDPDGDEIVVKSGKKMRKKNKNRKEKEFTMKVW